MTISNHKRGGVTLGTLTQMEPWEANLIISLRLWCDGPLGQMDVCDAYKRELPSSSSRSAVEDFERLVRGVIGHAHRPLVRHDVACSCVGADECVFLHLVRTASEGHLTDAILIATLLVSAAHAEQYALLAGAVGTQCRRMTCVRPALSRQAQSNKAPARVH